MAYQWASLYASHAFITTYGGGYDYGNTTAKSYIVGHPDINYRHRISIYDHICNFVSTVQVIAQLP